MTPSRHTRRSRRLSHRSPMEPADWQWQGVPSLQLLHSGSDVEVTPPAINLNLPFPSACTTTSSASPQSVVTHLPFTPGSSHTRNRKEGHIPRPPNAFMVFRSWLWNKDNLKSIERDNRNVSRIAGRYWNELSEAERAPFRCMAQEAKALHAKLYPEYRYSPGSQKKQKISQRRPQRDANLETEKCKKVADLLLGGATSRDLAKYLVEDRKGKSGEVTVSAAEESSLNVAPPNALQGTAEPRGESVSLQPNSKKPKTLPASSMPTAPFQYAIPLPFFSATGDSSATPGPSARTPKLALPDFDMEVFVATDDIPYFSLNDCDNLTPVEKKHEYDIPTLFPPHLGPGVHSVFSGIKPEATSFVDSCMLGTYTTGVLPLPSPIPFTEFDLEPFPSLIPLGSPVFSNPFEPSAPTAEHSAPLGTLDQLFGRPISPLTPIFPNKTE